MHIYDEQCVEDARTRSCQVNGVLRKSSQLHFHFEMQESWHITSNYYYKQTLQDLPNTDYENELQNGASAQRFAG